MARSIVFILMISGLVPPQSALAQPGATVAGLEPYRDSIPRTLVSFEMVPVPGGTVTVRGPGGPQTVEVRPFYIGRTEVTWDMYDIWALGLDLPPGALEAGFHAVSRPSEPYGAADYGWGRGGFAAISLTYDAAEAFCAWLSARTGRRYRLPSEAEWQRAADLAVGPGGLTPEQLDAIAWHAGNSGDQANAVASKQPDALGLHDLFGNVAEWVLTEEGRPLVRGGSFRDPAGWVGPMSRAMQDPSWTESDPQLPQSKWWLSDGPFVGFRIVRDP